MMNRIALFVAFFIMPLAAARTEKPVTCEAGHFVVGETAILTCRFPQDMTGSERHVYVVHHPFHTPNNFSGIDVLKCSGLNRGQLLCRVEEGYEFNYDITDHLTLKIPDVKERFAGAYVCQLVPPDGVPMNLCNLTVEDRTTTLETAVTTQGTPILQPPDNNDLIHNVFHGLLVVVILILLGVITYPCVKRRMSNRGNSHRTETPATAPEMRQMLPTCEAGVQTFEIVNVLDLTKKLEEHASKDESGYNTFDDVI